MTRDPAPTRKGSRPTGGHLIDGRDPLLSKPKSSAIKGLQKAKRANKRNAQLETPIEKQDSVASWVNEGGAGGEVKRP